jgi:hypothetical protein
MENLTETHKNVLRELVRLTRAGIIPEEFAIIWGIKGASILVPEKGFLDAPGITQLCLDALTSAGLLFTHVEMQTRSSEFGSSVTATQSESSRSCYVTPKGFNAVDSDFSPTAGILVHRPPVEISESLARFRADYPDTSRLAFIMMRFGKTSAHSSILSGIRQALEPHSLTALRADDKLYHDDLFFNILTYIYGCRFGIAVFERIEDEIINPNVSLEVGYMLGLGKSVCYLKDRTQRTLQSDLIGKLYREFDPHASEKSIPEALFQWLEDKGFIARRR